MRRIVLLGIGVLAGLLAASSGAEAAADISIFAYPPGDAAAAEGRPLASTIPRETIDYSGPYSPGSILISTKERRVCFVVAGRQADKKELVGGAPRLCLS